MSSPLSYPAAPAASGRTSARPLSTGLRVATIIFAVVAGLGLIVALIFVFTMLSQLNTDDWGFYLAFSVVVSLINVIPAIGAFVLGLIGRRSVGRLSLASTVIGALALVILAAQLVVLAVA